MNGLRFSHGAAIGVWIYCILWWWVQVRHANNTSLERPTVAH
jgi:hypothetical protein